MTTEPPTDIRVAQTKELAIALAAHIVKAAEVIGSGIALDIDVNGLINLAVTHLDPALRLGLAAGLLAVHPKGIFITPKCEFKSVAELEYDMFSDDPNRLRAQVERLWAEAPKATDSTGKVDETQAPAVACHATIRGIPPLQGILSMTPDKCLKLLCIVNDGRGGKSLVETFFDWVDLISVTVERQVTGTEESRIIS